jgi:hypothetical protein
MRARLCHPITRSLEFAASAGTWRASKRQELSPRQILKEVSSRQLVLPRQSQTKGTRWLKTNVSLPSDLPFDRRSSTRPRNSMQGKPNGRRMEMLPEDKNVIGCPASDLLP